MKRLLFLFLLFITEEEWGGDGETGEGSRRGLGECVGGFWSLAPTGSGYPRLVVREKERERERDNGAGADTCVVVF